MSESAKQVSPVDPEGSSVVAPDAPPPVGNRRGSLPPELGAAGTPMSTPVGPSTPSKLAKKLLADLVMTPPRTPPPPGATPKLFFPAAGDRVRALRDEAGPTSSPGRSPLSHGALPATTTEKPHADVHNSAAAAPPATLPKKLTPLTTAAGHHEHALPPQTGAVEFEGWLHKLKPKNDADATVGKWNKRWFVIRDGFLLYFKAPDSASPVGWLRLSQITSITDIATDVSIPGAAVTPPFCMKIQLLSRVLFVHASSQAELLEWKAHLQPQVYQAAQQRSARLDAATPPSYMDSPVAKHFSGKGAVPFSSPMRAPALMTEDTGESKIDAGAAQPDVLIPDDAVWIKCFDDANQCSYYVDAGSGESTWTIPLSADAGSTWVKCFDYQYNLVFFCNACTGEERYTPTEPAPDSLPEVPAPESGLVWIEAWDSTYNLPYYVHFGSGESQWEWPSAPGSYVVQHGTEDYNWYWRWLAMDPDAPMPTGSTKNLFGACFG